VLLRVPRSGTRARHRARHPLPAGQAREVPPSRPGPHPRRGGSRAGSSEQSQRSRGGQAVIAEFRLPDLGEGLTEAEVVQWMVEPGDTVSLNQTLAEVETAKAVVELPSPYEGTVASLHARAGDTVLVGAPLIAFDIAGAEPEAVEAAPAADAADAGEVKAQPNLVGYGAAPASSGRPARRARRGTPSDAAARADAAVLEAAPHDALPPSVAEPTV